MPTLSRPMFPVAFPPPLPTASPYSNLPWTNSYWCEQQGLKLGQGLDGGLSDEVLGSLSPTQRAHFSPTALSDAKLFLREIQARHRQKQKTYRQGMDKAPGYAAFRSAMLALIDRPGGIHDTIWNAMVDKRATPVDALRDARFDAEEKGQPFDEDNTKVIPKPSIYWDNVRVHLARSLFGEQALNRHSGSVKEEYLMPLHDLFARTWGEKKSSLVSAIKKRATLPDIYREAVAAALHKPTAKNLMVANKALSMWRGLADLTGEVDSLYFKQQEEVLSKLWESLGRSRDKSGRVHRTPAIKQLMCTEEELDAAYQHYLELHFPPAGLLDSFLDSQVQRDPQIREHALTDLGTDLGVQDLLDKDIEQVVHMMGLPAGSVSFPFAERGTSAAGGTGPGREPIKLDWHQWLGTAALTRAWFTRGLGEQPAPMMLCDEVGLGKTMQFISSIGVLAHYIERQERQLELPPVISDLDRQYFAGLDSIPSLPILIIVPRALSTQWRNETLRYTEHGAFQVILYSNNLQKREEFFKPGGIWDTHVTNSKRKHRTIVIAELNVSNSSVQHTLADLGCGIPVKTIGKEAEQCLRRVVRSKNDLQKAAPLELVPNCEYTIFRMLFLLGIVDEMHGLRNPNMQWEGVLALLDRCAVRQSATATPVWTGYNDIVSALRLLRDPKMIGDSGVAQSQALDQMERASSKLWTQGDSAEEFATILATKRAEAQGDTPLSPEALGQSVQQILEMEKKNLRAFFVSYRCLTHLKTLLGTQIIRRDFRSLDRDGRKVLDLLPFIESLVLVQLTEAELEAIKGISKRRPNAVSGQAGVVAWVDFLIDYRFVAFHCWLLQRKDLKHFWAKWDMKLYIEQASSKLRTMMLLIQHHHQDQDAAPLFFGQDGQPTAAPDGLSILPATRPRKFIVFAMYHFPRLIIKKVLDLHGLQHREFDGEMSPALRNKALKDFDEDEEVLILLMSNVGGVGLNITRASIILFMDQPWSFSELKQIIGRPWRRGQLDQVFVYRLIAAGTADETLLGIANGKELMSEHLITDSNLLQSIHGRDELSALDSEPEHNDTDEEPQVKPLRKPMGSKVKPRELKRARESTGSTTAADTYLRSPDDSSARAATSSKLAAVTKQSGSAPIPRPLAKRSRRVDSPNPVAQHSAGLVQDAPLCEAGNSPDPSAAPALPNPEIPGPSKGKGKAVEQVDGSQSNPVAVAPSTPTISSAGKSSEDPVLAQLQGLLKVIPREQIAANPTLLAALVKAGLWNGAVPDPQLANSLPASLSGPTMVDQDIPHGTQSSREVAGSSPPSLASDFVSSPMVSSPDFPSSSPDITSSPLDCPSSPIDEILPPPAYPTGATTHPDQLADHYSPVASGPNQAGPSQARPSSPIPPRGNEVIQIEDDFSDLPSEDQLWEELSRPRQPSQSLPVHPRRGTQPVQSQTGQASRGQSSLIQTGEGSREGLGPASGPAGHAGQAMNLELFPVRTDQLALLRSKKIKRR